MLFRSIARVRKRVPANEDANEEIEELIRSTDQQRADHIRTYFGCSWKDLHLYHMLVSSEVGEEQAARIILKAVQCGQDQIPERVEAPGHCRGGADSFDTTALSFSSSPKPQ